MMRKSLVCKYLGKEHFRLKKHHVQRLWWKQMAILVKEWNGVECSVREVDSTVTWYHAS
jgi:hypothetical protein